MIYEELALQEIICVVCTNVNDTKTQDNIEIRTCTPGIIQSDFERVQTSAAYSDKQGEFIFESFSEGCENLITYEIGTQNKKGQIPDGLIDELVVKECG